MTSQVPEDASPASIAPRLARGMSEATLGKARNQQRLKSGALDVDEGSLTRFHHAKTASVDGLVYREVVHGFTS